MSVVAATRSESLRPALLGQPRTSAVVSLRLFAAVAGVAVALTGALVLAGWALEVKALKSVAPGLVTMKPNTALCFLLSGVALWLLHRERAGRLRRAVARGLSVFVAAVGLLTLSQYLAGWNLGIDQLLFGDASAAAGRMSPATAVSFLLVGLALLLLDVAEGVPAQYVALAAGLVSLIALIGYAYDVSTLYRFGPYSTIAIHTASAFVLLSSGLLGARSEHGFMALVTSSQPGGALVRRMLLPIVVIPLVVGWLRLQGEQAGLYRTEVGVALFATTNIVLFLALLAWTARSLNRFDTERYQAQETLRRNEARMRSILEAALDGVIGMDSAGCVLSWNERAEAIFGWPREEAIGRRVADLIIPPRFRESHARGLAKFLATGEGPVLGRRLELSAVRRDGSEFPVELTVTALREEDACIFNAFVADITERKLAQEAERRARESEEQTRLAREASRLKSEFLANMSHELRTPLNAIIGFSEVIQDGRAGPVSDKQEEYLQDILASSQHLLQLINDVLDLSRIEAGKMEFTPERVDLAQAVKEVQNNLRPLAEKKRIRFEAETDPALGEVELDPLRLKQVLYNYLSNALKFTPAEGRVTVRARAEGDRHLRLEVEDTGIGIRPEDLGRLFADFEQLETGSTKKHAGTGLGLALTRRLVEAQGGRVGVESLPGRGSTFFAILPRTAGGHAA